MKTNNFYIAIKFLFFFFPIMDVFAHGNLDNHLELKDNKPSVLYDLIDFLLPNAYSEVNIQVDDNNGYRMIKKRWYTQSYNG